MGGRGHNLIGETAEHIDALDAANPNRSNMHNNCAMLMLTFATHLYVFRSLVRTATRTMILHAVLRIELCTGCVFWGALG